MSESAGKLTAKLDDIFHKFGKDVKKLSIFGCIPKEKQLLKWLKEMPLLEEIDFAHMGIDDESKNPIPTLDLPRLTKVSFKECLVGNEMNLINAFPKGVIQEVWWINCFQRKKAEQFLKNQPNIKTLTLGCDSLAAEGSFNKLNLTKLTIKNDFGPPCKMFCRQRNLTSLSLKDVQLNDVMFNLICTIKHLQNLKFDVWKLSASSLKNLEGLKNLTSLEVREGDENQLNAIVSLTMPSLEMLSLWMFPELEYCWEYEVSERFPNLKKIRLGPCESLGSIESLLETFPQLEGIKMAMAAEGEIEHQYQPYAHIIDHTKLRTFYIAVNSYLDQMFFDVMPFLDAAENLEEIYIHTPLHINFLRHLLNTKKSLTKLVMKIDNNSSKMDYITDKITGGIDGYAPQLRFLQLNFSTNTWNMDIDMAMIKKLLLGRFPIIVMDPCSLVFKKRGEGSLQLWDE